MVATKEGLDLPQARREPYGPESVERPEEYASKQDEEGSLHVQEVPSVATAAARRCLEKSAHSCEEVKWIRLADFVAMVLIF